MNTIFSSQAELTRLARIIQCCCRLPVSNDAVPGAFLETVLAHVREAEVVPTYDYVDVVDKKSGVGWSIKSTKSTTPMTWKRAKIASKAQLIAESRGSKAAVQKLGDTLIAFCNAHAAESLAKYNLAEIGYARLILFPRGKVRYFERSLCTAEKPRIFEPNDFRWDWSVEKKTSGKEQLSALHGFHNETGKRWWAWHGLGENQLHFTGEANWWPEDDHHAISFELPTPSKKLSFDQLLEVLAAL